ncbi:2-nitroimidazole nitrohydrolase [subsurface metagenome]
MSISKSTIWVSKGRQEVDTLEKIPNYREGMPHRPIYGTDFLDDLAANWGEEWGIKSAFGKIRKIMAYRPADEQKHELISKDHQLFNLPAGPTDLDKLQKEHDSLVSILKAEGIEVVFLEPKKPLIGTYGIPLRSAPYTRETVMVRGGAIIERPAPAYKKGLEVFHARRLMELGCPILYTIHRKGVFEASNMVWIDDTSVILATGLRGNMEGARQVEAILRDMGVEDIHFAQLPGYLYNRPSQVGGSSGIFHLDMAFGMAYYQIGVLWPGGVGYDTILWLESKGVDLIELTDEELPACAPNLLPIAPKKVIVSAFNLRMTEELRKRGIEVIELDLSEFAKGGGGPTCLTLPLIRD